MSERARAYYENRTNQLGLESTPDILDGHPVSLMPTDDDELTSEFLATGLASHFKTLESYVIEGIRYVDGRKLDDNKWQQVRGLPPHTKVRSVDKYAMGIVHYLLEAPGSDIVLEALTQAEASSLSYTWRYATQSGALRVRPPGQEVARVALLARTVTHRGRSSSAHLTILWGEYNEIIPTPRSRPRFYVTPRYFGAPVVQEEIALLPPLR